MTDVDATTEPVPSISIWKHVRLPIIEAVILYLFFVVTAHLAVSSSTGGELYDLRPHGIGACFEALIVVVLITAFHLFYTLPALFARRWLGNILRFMMYGLFVVFLSWLHWEKFVAVRLTSDRVIIVRHYPRPPIEIPRAALQQPELHDTGAAATLNIWFDSNEPYPSVPVYRVDSSTTATLARLAGQLNARHRLPS